jgi:hypothetical protein
MEEENQLNHHNSQVNTTRDPKDKSHLYGTELLNDLRLPKIKSPNLRSTPDSGRYMSNRDSHNNTKHTNISSIDQANIELVQRKIIKRDKKSKSNKVKQPYSEIVSQILSIKLKVFILNLKLK